MGERRHLLALPPLRGPAGLERLGEGGPHGVHRGEDVVHLAHVGAADREVELPRADAPRRLRERRHLARDHAARAARHERERERASRSGADEHEVLRVGKQAGEVARDPLRQVLADECAGPAALEWERGVGEARAPALDLHCARIRGKCRTGHFRRALEPCALEVCHQHVSVLVQDEVAVRRRHVLLPADAVACQALRDLARIGRPPACLVDEARVDRRGERHERGEPRRGDRRERVGEVARDDEGERHAPATSRPDLQSCHLYPIPQTVAIGSAPASESFLRARLTCMDMAASSASLSQPSTASRICARLMTCPG